MSHLGHRKPACIHWKADEPKTRHCLVRILIQRHNLAIFHRKWARRGRYSQWRSLSSHVERIFFTKIEEEDIDNVWFQQDGAICRTAQATLDVLRSGFENCVISHIADVVWAPRSCDLTPLDYYLWIAFKDKCCVVKSEAAHNR